MDPQSGSNHMARTPFTIRNLTATLWALVFTVCLGLAAAHLVTAVQAQLQQEANLIETTFTRAPARP